MIWREGGICMQIAPHSNFNFNNNVKELLAFSSMDRKRPRVTPVHPEWDLGMVLEALSKAPYESLFKLPHL